MARPAKQGFDYFSVDTDRFQDRRIKSLRKSLGCMGFAVYEYILNEIYRVRGCFLEWDECTAFDVADYWGLKENQVREIVRYCGAVGLFDNELLSRGVISSASIQRRYLEMCSRAKRKDVRIPDVCRLVREETGLITEETELIREETGFTVEISTQSKVKESKEKEKKSEIKEKTALSPPSSSSSPDRVFEGALKGFADVLASLKNGNEAWRDAVAKNNGIDPGALDGWIDRFGVHCRASGEEHVTVASAKRHFNSWLRKSLVMTTQNRNYNGKTEQADRFSKRRGVDTSARSPEDYTGTL